MSKIAAHLCLRYQIFIHARAVGVVYQWVKLLHTCAYGIEISSMLMPPLSSFTVGSGAIGQQVNEGSGASRRLLPMSVCSGMFINEWSCCRHCAYSIEVSSMLVPPLSSFTVGSMWLVNKYMRALVHHVTFSPCLFALGCLSMSEVAADIVPTVLKSHPCSHHHSLPSL